MSDIIASRDVKEGFALFRSRSIINIGTGFFVQKFRADFFFAKHSCRALAEVSFGWDRGRVLTLNHFAFCPLHFAFTLRRAECIASEFRIPKSEFALRFAERIILSK